MYDAHRLRLLLELRRRGTLSAVAEALHFSTSTVSHQLSQLESEVGAKLLEPAGRRVKFTPQAEILVRHAEAVVRELEAAKSAVANSLAEVTGTVRIASFQTGLLHFLSPLLDTLAADYPGISLEIFQAEPEVSLKKLLAYEYDLVLVEEYPGQNLPRTQGIDYRPLLDDPMKIVFPSQALRDSGLLSSERELWDLAATLPWVMEPRGSASRSWIIKMCREAKFEPRITFSTDDLMVQRQIVENGHAVACLPQILGVEDNAALAAFSLPHSQDFRSILSAVRAEAAAHPAIEACRKVLKMQSSVIRATEE